MKPGRHAVAETQEILKIKRTAKHIDYLLKKYADDLKRCDDEDYTGSFHIFEFDGPLWEMMFSTEYAQKYLDYEFICTILHHLIVGLELRNGMDICIQLLSYIKDTQKDRDWIALFPVAFTGGLIRSQHKGNLKFGRYVLLEPHKAAEELSETLKEQLNAHPINAEEYKRFADERYSGGALGRYSILTFEVSCTEENRNFSSIQKFEYFRRVFEVFAVDSKEDLHICRRGLDDIHHVFFANKYRGDMGFHPLQHSSRIGPKLTEKLHEYLLANDFELFVNRIFYIEDKVFARIRSALYFFSKGFNGSDHVMAFLSYVISIECLFANGEMTKIKETLAQYVSNLCCEENERSETQELMRQLYKQRSDIVHSGRFDLRNDLIDKAKSISARAILACFKLHAFLLEETSTTPLQERYFERLNCMGV
ncbi:TPA: HEPN domain-containing protein [Pseudomonas aeruginosa]|nr:hypothetical protein [Pseudomonas aeruginosa]